MSDSYSESLDVRDVGDVTVVGFKGRRILDEPTVQLINQELCRLVEKHGCKKMLLNFGNVEYLSSAALGQLINLHRKMMSVGGRISFCNVAPQIFEVFEVTKLDKTFRIDPYPDEANEDDPEGNMGGVTARLKPPKPSGGESVSLHPPPPESDE